MLRFENTVFYSDGGFQIGEMKVDGVNVSLKGRPLTPLDQELLNKTVIIPGFVDVHTHLREPGFFYKESIKSGTEAAASAGYVALCAMPNLNPVPDSLSNLQIEEQIISRDALIPVYPYASITKGQKGEELSDMSALAPRVCAFSDDGRGVQTGHMMREAMLTARSLNKVIVAHCEDNSLLKAGGCVHEGEYAARHGLTGISSASEYKQVERDIQLVRETGCRYHVCHISTAESAELIKVAKKEGLPVTAETAPHYLTLSQDDLKDEGRFKMNPPLRTAADRDALIGYVADGTIDCIATDHAPHSDEEKSKGLKASAFGIIGLETAFSVLFTKLVKTGKLSLERLIDAMSVKPRVIFGLPNAPADLAVVNLAEEWTVEGKKSISKGNSTPFEGWKIAGINQMTIINGEIVWNRQKEN